MRKLSMLFAGVLIAGALIIGLGAGGYSPSTFITHTSQLVNDSGFAADTTYTNQDMSVMTNWANASADGDLNVGGNLVTNAPNVEQRQYVYLNSSREFADNPDAFTTNNISIARTMYAAAFPVGEDNYSDTMWFDVPGGWGGVVNIQGDFWNDGTAGDTTPAVKIYDPLTSAQLGVVTGSAVTIQASSGITNRQSFNQDLDISGLTVTNFGVRVGWLSTNSVPTDTRDADNNQEYFSVSVTY